VFDVGWWRLIAVSIKSLDIISLDLKLLGIWVLGFSSGDGIVWFDSYLILQLGRLCLESLTFDIWSMVVGLFWISLIVKNCEHGALLFRVGWQWK
jgi:hypothetical protein